MLSSRQTSLSCRDSLADNHHPGGTGPPEPREWRLVQAALPSLNLLNTMQLKKLPRGARHWHSDCSVSSGPFSRARWRYLGKFKLLAALLGFLIAITGAVSAQNLTTKRRIDFNASNKKREHNKERLVMIVLEGILSLLHPDCFLPLSSRVPSTQKTGWYLYEYRFPKSHKGDPYL